MEEKLINGVPVSKWISDVKEKLAKVGNEFKFGNDFKIELTDDNKYHCVYAEVRNKLLYVAIFVPTSTEPIEINESEFSLIKYPNAIINEIHVADPKDEVVNEIVSKLFVQPEMPYVFEELFLITLEDGNTFGVERVEMDDDGILTIILYNEYVEPFEIDVEHITEESLQIISDEIRPPMELRVTLVGGNDAFLVKNEYVMWNTTEEQMLQKLKEWFPAFDWQEVGESQFKHYLDYQNNSVYFLASLLD